METIDSQPNVVPQTGYDLFAFGDSLSDIGSFFDATGGLLPPSPPYFDGRFSNGPLAVEKLAASLGFGLSESMNFAIGGAQTGRTNVNDTATLQFGGLLNEIDQFTGQANDLGAGAEDLYFIWAGSNDLLSQPSDPVTAVNAAVNNIATAVSTLVQSGAKNIIVGKLPNLGRIPASLQQGQFESLTLLSSTFNTALESTLNALEGSSNDVNIILTDIFAVGESVAQNPAAFGFSNVTDPFLVGLTPGDPNANPDEFFFWDQFHPTTRSHSIFADAFRDTTISGIVEDITRIGTAASEQMVGFSGNDLMRGRGGTDLIEGNPGNDRLEGNGGNDTVFGGIGNDLVLGGIGNDSLEGGLDSDVVTGGGGADTLVGVDPDAPDPGRGEIDMLTGGGKADVFVLGNEASAFYDDGLVNRRGWRDFAVIMDFGRGKDVIQLHGSIDEYRLQRAPRQLSLGTAIYLKTEGRNELICIVANNTTLELNSDAFTFV